MAVSWILFEMYSGAPMENPGTKKYRDVNMTLATAKKINEILKPPMDAFITFTETMRSQ
jgi:hypothetical protein